jgi:hypothetical protein
LRVRDLLVPLPPGTEPDPADGGSAAHVFADRMREARPAVEADRSRVRLSVGVSAPAPGAVALSGALHEASSARRLAALRSEAAITIVTSDEVASHELLLATVPGSVLRSFRQRTLGPLVAYDQRHRAELLPLERLRHDDVGARQHRAVPDQADRGAHRTRSVLAG